MGTGVSETAQNAIETLWVCVKIESVEQAEVKKSNDRLHIGAKVDRMKRF